MKITYRVGKKEDSSRIAELDYIASSGASEYLFHDLVPGLTAVQVVAQELENDSYPHSYRSAIVAECNHQIIGMALSFPAKLHCISDEMKSIFPAERIEYFRDFFTSRIEGSYLLDAICVDENYRNRGIGHELLEKTILKARDEGYKTLSLIVFSDNNNAINFYRKHGFEVAKHIALKSHKLIPHQGGCLLMKADI